MPQSRRAGMMLLEEGLGLMIVYQIRQGGSFCRKGILAADSLDRQQMPAGNVAPQCVGKLLLAL